MGTEKIIMRDATSDNGMIGMTRKQPALVKWILFRYFAAIYSSQMNERGGLISKDNSSHIQNQPAVLKQYKNHAQALVEHLQNNMTNLFELTSHPKDTLINISTGMHANDKNLIFNRALTL